MHKLTISNLDDFEAEHIGQILSDYKCKILMRKIEALVRNDEGSQEWYDAHLGWHDEIMKKIEWSKE